MLNDEEWSDCMSLLVDESSLSSLSSLSWSFDEADQPPLQIPVGKKRSIEEARREAKKCRRRQHPSRIYIPKMDIRKRITAMLANAINARDSPLLAKFLHRYARGDMTMLTYFDRLRLYHSSPILSLIKGSANVVNYASSCSLCIPDACVQLKSSEIRVNWGRSVIISEVVMEGTVMLQPQPRAVDLRFASLLKQGTTVVQDDDGLKAAGPQADEMNLILAGSDDSFAWCADHVALPVAVPYRRKGFVIIKLDENDLIESVSVVDAFDSVEKYFLPLQSAVYSQFKR